VESEGRQQVTMFGLQARTSSNTTQPPHSQPLTFLSANSASASSFPSLSSASSAPASNTRTPQSAIGTTVAPFTGGLARTASGGSGSGSALYERGNASASGSASSLDSEHPASSAVAGAPGLSAFGHFNGIHDAVAGPPSYRKSCFWCMFH
jgi:hypothetical protein